MRVFAPERLVTTKYYNCDLFLPLQGEWKQLPDYFRQVTRNKPVNDVIHAKLVDQIDDSYVYPDLHVHVGNREYNLYQTVGTASYMGISRYQYKMVQRLVELSPSPNYKGKKRAKRFVQRWVPEGFAYTGFARSVGYNPDGRFWYKILHLAIMVLPESPHSYYGGLASCFCEILVGWNGTSRYDTLEPKIYIQNWSDPRLLELFQPLLDYGSTLKSRTRPSWTNTEINKRTLQILESIMAEHGEEVRDLVRARTLRSNWHNYAVLGYDYASSVDQIAFSDVDYRRAFLLNEPDIIGEKLDPILLGRGGGLSHYWIENLTQHALLEACDSLPRLNENSLSNIIEIVGFVKALVVDHKIEIPKSLSDAWLSYRYQYQTTKADVKDAIKFVHRHMDLGTLDRMIVGKGTHSIDYNGTSILCRCSVEVTPKETNWLSKIWRALDQYGLTPDFYVIWDMVPYSFMADWFLPIGNLAGVWDANAMYFSGEYYNLANICYSLSYVRELDRGDGNIDHVKCYTRWAGSVPSSLNSFYWFEPPSASRTTVGRRILDAASIFIG